uniref:Uncharacterized protein n=1 Tax=Ananas comosus var. bracteatus TaxID=296719 RepID=A0A6V7QEJ8_ANACO|nr:unnamed protein product [Ananas comosus var. bracteatus]
MPAYRQYSRIDTVELKNQLFKKLGKQKAEKYFYILKKLLDHKLSKWEFNRLCYNTIGKENIALHNRFIQSILGNACLAFGRLLNRQRPATHEPVKFLMGILETLSHHLLGGQDQ